MDRDAYQALGQWKRDRFRKPLLLLGARQTGKTYLLKEFGRKEYGHLVYCNFEEDPGLHGLFSGSLEADQILKALALYKGAPIRPGEDLLFLDEIQLCNGALNALKYLLEEAPEYHVVAAGSLLGVKLTGPLSFPVGKVTMRHLYPLTFAEFLDAMGQHPLRAMLDGIDKVEPVPGPLHERLVALLKTYYVVGGMPEAVRMYAETGWYDRTREVHADILGVYERDFAKHVPTVDIPRVSLIWDSVPTQLARENRKFIFSALSGSARAREYEAALRWLRDAGLVYLANAVSTVQQPLAGFANRAAFKVYALDTGLLAAKARLPAATVLDGNALFTTYHGMLVENYVAQHLMSMPGPGTSLHYWQSESHGAEVDFLVDMPPDVFPLEVKAGINPRSKSLKSYDGRFHPPRLLRTTLLNFAVQERITNIPLYAISLLPKLVSAL